MSFQLKKYRYTVYLFFCYLISNAHSKITTSKTPNENDNNHQQNNTNPEISRIHGKEWSLLRQIRIAIPYLDFFDLWSDTYAQHRLISHHKIFQRIIDRIIHSSSHQQFSHRHQTSSSSIAASSTSSTHQSPPATIFKTPTRRALISHINVTFAFASSGTAQRMFCTRRSTNWLQLLLANEIHLFSYDEARRVYTLQSMASQWSNHSAFNSALRVLASDIDLYGFPLFFSPVHNMFAKTIKKENKNNEESEKTSMKEQQEKRKSADKKAPPSPPKSDKVKSDVTVDNDAANVNQKEKQKIVPNFSSVSSRSSKITIRRINPCSVLFIFSRTCLFSQSAAPNFVALSRYFPHLHFIAVPIETYIDLRWGVQLVTVPKIQLHIGNRSAIKYNGSDFDLDQLVEFITQKTGILPTLTTSHLQLRPAPVSVQFYDVYLGYLLINNFRADPLANRTREILATSAWNESSRRYAEQIIRVKQRELIESGEMILEAWLATLAALAYLFSLTQTGIRMRKKALEKCCELHLKIKSARL